MTEATPKRSTLILSAKATLTKEQGDFIKERVRAELPADVGLILLDSQLTLAAIFPAAE